MPTSRKAPPDAISPMRGSSRSCFRARFATTSSTGSAHDPLGDPDEDRERHDAPDRRGEAHRQSGRERSRRPGSTARSRAPRTRTSSIASSSISSTRSGCKEDIYRFGLSGMVDPEQHPELAGAADRGAKPAARAACGLGHGRARRAVRCRALQPPGDDRREPPVRRPDLAGPDRARACRARPLPRGAEGRGHRRGARRHGRADRRDDGRDLPRPAARASAVRAVLVRRRRRASRVRGHHPPAGAPQRRGLQGQRPDAVPGPAARLYRAAPSPRPSRRRGRGSPRQGPPRRARAARARTRSRRRVLRCREGLRRSAPQGQPPLRPGQSQRRQRAGAGHGGDHRRRRRARPAAEASSGSGCRIRSDRPGGC